MPLSGVFARFVSLSVFLVAAAGMVHAVDLSSIPKPTGYVSDLANALGPSDKQTIEDFCGRVDHELNAQFAIVTINTLGDEPIEQFTIDLGRKWGVGNKKDEGLLLLLVIKDHKQRIEVGRGLEAYIPDAFAGNTMDASRPLLRQANYGGALMQMVQALAGRIADGKNIAFSVAPALPETPRRQPRHDSGGGIPISLIIFGIVFVLLFIVGRRGGGGRGSGSGFWMGFLLSSLFNSGRGDRGSGSGWGGGGGFGGGSDGGGGFGGFGGGDFGGGGASSDW